MRLEATAKFATVVGVRSQLIKVAAEAGQVLDLDLDVYTAVEKDLPGYLRVPAQPVFAISEAVPAFEPVEIAPEPKIAVKVKSVSVGEAVGKTRQAVKPAKLPVRKPRAKKG
jgi:hypothetical protein